MNRPSPRWHVLVALATLGLILVAALPGAASAQVAFCGKYRGTVVSSLDPLLSGRVQVAVPAIGITAAWALPAVPFGRSFMTPAVGQSLWIEFEACDPSFPVWTGGFLASCRASRDVQSCKLLGDR